MKIALINDTHFGARSDSPQFNEFFFKFWEQTFFPYLQDHNIKTVVHLGDVVDRRKFINHYIADQFQTRFMRRLWQDGIDTHIIIGNHDTYYKNTNKINAIQNLCLSYDGRHEPWVYTDPKIVEFDGVPILFLPWICDDNREASLQLIRTAPVSLVMGHLEISGFEMDRGHVCTTGEPAEVFDRFELVMSGHFHHQSRRGPIHYLGNPYEITWTDYDDQRGFQVFDTQTRELTFVPNPYRMFYKLIYDDTTQTFDTWKQTDWSQYKDVCVKVVVKNKQNPYLFDSVLDKLYQTGPFDLAIVENYLPVTDDLETVSVDQAQDTLTILHSYIDSLKMDVEAPRLKELMNTLYHDALMVDRSL